MAYSKIKIKRIMILKTCILMLTFFLFFFPGNVAIASIDYGKQTLIGDDFSNLDLKGSTFYLTNLQDADLSGSNLEGASLFGAKLLNTDLSNTNLKNATLDSAVFEGTNLSNAILEDAFAYSARFNNVNINGTDFTNVSMQGDQLSYLCSIAEGINSITGRYTKESLECR